MNGVFEAKATRFRLGLPEPSSTQEWPAVTGAVLVSQLDNPQCPKDELVYLIGRQLTRTQLDNVRGLTISTRLALRAFLGDQGAAQAFMALPLKKYYDWAVWLRAAQLGGDGLYQAALKRALDHPPWTTAFRDDFIAPWLPVLDHSREQVKPWLLQWIQEPGHSPAFYFNAMSTLSRNLPGPYPCGTALERLAHHADRRVSSLAFGLLLDDKRAENDAALVRLVSLSPEAILTHFERTICAEIVPLAPEYLNHADPKVRRAARQALYFQTRVDLGYDASAWKKSDGGRGSFSRGRRWTLGFY